VESGVPSGGVIRETIYRHGQRCLVTEARKITPLPETTFPWHILRVAPKAEARVVKNLGAINLTAWVPLVTRTVTQSRRVVLRGDRPLLPGYVFAALDPFMPRIFVTTTSGVLGFLCHTESGLPVLLRKDEMARLADPATSEHEARRCVLAAT
jgi:transcription antitermination factor NusG